MCNLMSTKRMSVVPTMRCTLRCKLCSNHMPAFENPTDVPAQDLMRDIDLLFQIFDKIEWLQFVGGEIFLHQNLAQVYEHCIQYSDQFDKLILETNATIAPRDEELNVLKKLGDKVNVMISDYGTLSSQKETFIKKLESNGIPFILKKYYDENQHCGGWIDNTGRKNYGEKEEILLKNYKNCPQLQIENMHCYDGKIYSCPNSLFMSQLGIFSPNRNDYVDMLEETSTLNEKRDIIRDFYNHPTMACRYCLWKYADTVARFPAAEQIKD